MIEINIRFYQETPNQTYSSNKTPKVCFMERWAAKFREHLEQEEQTKPNAKN